MAGVLLVKALNRLVTEILKSDSSLGNEVRKKVLEKADTKLLTRTRDEINRELGARAESFRRMEQT